MSREVQATALEWKDAIFVCFFLFHRVGLVQRHYLGEVGKETIFDCLISW